MAPREELMHKMVIVERGAFMEVSIVTESIISLFLMIWLGSTHAIGKLLQMKSIQAW